MALAICVRHHRQGGSGRRGLQWRRASAPQRPRRQLTPASATPVCMVVVLDTATPLALLKLRVSDPFVSGRDASQRSILRKKPTIGPRRRCYRPLSGRPTASNTPLTGEKESSQNGPVTAAMAVFRNDVSYHRQSLENQRSISGLRFHHPIKRFKEKRLTM